MIPKSIPIVVLSSTCNLGRYSVSVSQRIDTKYFPVDVIEMVADLIVPSNGLCNLILIPFFLNLGITNLPSSTLTFCGMWKDCLVCFDLNLGKPAPLKNLLYAKSKFYTHIVVW